MDNTSTVTKKNVKTSYAPMFRCLLHNDDHNVMEYVASVLCKVFAFNWHEAVNIMTEAHKTGVALCRIEVFEQAEFHRDQLKSYGLSSTIEPA